MGKKNQYTKEELLASGRGELFGPEQAQLPSPPMLMCDRITLISDEGGAHGKGEIHAEYDVTPEAWFFGCHFQGDPVMPGCLGFDAMLQLLGFYLAWLGYPGKGRALGVGELKFRGQVLPHARLVTYRLDIRRVLASRLVLARADGTVAVDGKEIYFAKDLRCGVFTEPAAMGE